MMRPAIVFATALAVLQFTSSPASALDIGHCDAPEKMTELLKAEGQRSLAHGNQEVLGEELPSGELRAGRKTIGLIFTADDAGRVGYVLQASHPIGARADKICVAERFHNVRLYDVRKPGLPAEAMLNSTDEAAARKCADLAKARTVGRGSCGFLNTMLKRIDPLGERVMILGLGVRKQADGGWKPDGTLITVTANMTGDRTARDGRGAIQFTVLPEGATVIASVFTGTAYTETALRRLAGR